MSLRLLRRPAWLRSGRHVNAFRPGAPSVETARVLSGLRGLASAKHSPPPSEHYNEPEGNLFGRIRGKHYPPDWTIRIYVIFYLGGLAVFAFLYQYKPDTDATSWARREALRRMEERGVDLESYRYQLPKVY